MVWFGVIQGLLYVVGRGLCHCGYIPGQEREGWQIPACLVFWRKKTCGKGKFLISGHIPLVYYLPFANMCVFALYLSQRKCVSVSLPKRLLKLVFGWGSSSSQPAAPGDCSDQSWLQLTHSLNTEHPQRAVCNQARKNMKRKVSLPKTFKYFQTTRKTGGNCND